MRKNPAQGVDLRLEIYKTVEFFSLTPKSRNYEAEWWRSLTQKIFQFICKNKKALYKAGQHYSCCPAESLTFVWTSQLTFQKWIQFCHVHFRAFSPWTLKISENYWFSPELQVQYWLIVQKNLFYLVVEVSVSVAPTKTDLFGRSKRNNAHSWLRKVDFFFVIFYFSGNSTVLQISSLKTGNL